MPARIVLEKRNFIDHYMARPVTHDTAGNIVLGDPIMEGTLIPSSPAVDMLVERAEGNRRNWAAETKARETIEGAFKQILKPIVDALKKPA